MFVYDKLATINDEGAAGAIAFLAHSITVLRVFGDLLRNSGHLCC